MSSQRESNGPRNKQDRAGLERERKKHRAGVHYWRTRANTGENSLLSYWDVGDARTDELVRTMLSLISIKNAFSAWEFGCNSGRNMLAIQSRFPRARIRGNDINVPAVKFARSHGLNVVHRDTIGLLQEMKAVDITISMAHLMHLSKLYNGVLKTHFARVTRSWLFCVEPTRDLDGWRVWKRNYPQFFIRDFELVQDRPSCIPGADYRIYVFKKKAAWGKRPPRPPRKQH